MAANLQSRVLVSFGKRFINQICGGNSFNPSRSISPSFRRVLHGSVYDKNPDDEIPPTLVPDEVIHPQSDKYWAPHPETGVFGPCSKENPAAGFNSLPANASEETVLQQKAFFCPLEDLDKPLP